MVSKSCLLVLSAVLCAGLANADTEIEVIPLKPTAVYQPGEAIVWQVKLRGSDADSIHQATYVLKQGGATISGQGSLVFSNQAATIRTSLAVPGTVLAEITATNASHQSVKALGGAAVDPEKIPISSPCPDDFDAFWKTKLDELAVVPENAVLEKGVCETTNVDYWKIKMDNIRGTHIYGQLARPVSNQKKLPAMLVLQHAGVYPLLKKTVVDRAAEGWLVLNITAHDLPIDAPPSFYSELATNELKNYTAIGNDNREHSYFLRMVLACYRAVEYLSERDDWDGKTLVVTGGSQGGFQSFVAAGLNPKVTAMMALVPAGCDDTGDLLGRRPGWPFWMMSLNGSDPAKARLTSRYFDAVNFAARVKCPALVGLGLIDTTSPPSGIFAAVNQLKGPHEVVVMPLSEHMEKNNSRAAYTQRQIAWSGALRKGNPIPPK